MAAADVQPHPSTESCDCGRLRGVILRAANTIDVALDEAPAVRIGLLVELVLLLEEALDEVAA